MARDLFGRHSGPWRVDQVPANSDATAFWRRAIPVPFEEQVAADGSTTQTFTL